MRGAIGRWALPLLASLAVALTAAPRIARAQPSIDVAALIKLVEEQPADMDRATWKEKRREAAKRLGTIRDKRAVVTLAKLAENETFDIIGEIAIQGLGQLGDPSAAPALQRIAADAAREKSQRELARKTLAKLGVATEPGGSPAAPSPPPPTTGPAPRPSSGGRRPPRDEPRPSSGKPAEVKPSNDDPDEDSAADDGEGPEDGEDGEDGVDTAGVGAALLDEGTGPAGPTWQPQVLAAAERLTLGAGSARLSYDTARKRPAFEGDLAATYEHRVDELARMIAWGGDARVIAGYVNPDGAGANRGAVVTAAARGEARFYSGKVFGVGLGVGRLGLTYLSIDRADPNAQDTKDVRTSADLEIALGAGYGRVLDQGPRLRVRRLARALEAHRALGRPIDEATARELQSAWWALRSARSARRALTSTVSILRRAGVLLGEPDAALTYELLGVLRDGQLADRPSGMEVWLGFGEGYLLREDEPQVADGRVEQLLARGRLGQQREDGVADLTADAFARLALFTGDAPAPWALGASARVRRFTYGEYGDPLGAFDLRAEVALSSDDRDNTSVGLRIGGELGFSWVLDLASEVRVSAAVFEDAGELTVLGGLQARYGLLDGAFAAP